MARPPDIVWLLCSPVIKNLWHVPTEMVAYCWLVRAPLSALSFGITLGHHVSMIKGNSGKLSHVLAAYGSFGGGGGGGHLVSNMPICVRPKVKEMGSFSASCE